MKLATHAIALVLALGLAACGTPAPKEQFFTLSSPNAGVARAASDTPSIFVGPVAIPEAVDRSQMVLRTGPNQVDVSDDYRWAEPLQGAIARVVADTLARELGTSRVATSRQASGGATDYRVAIEVQRFEAALGQGGTVEALWTVHPAKGAPRTGHTLAQVPAAAHDPGALAGALSQALTQVGHDIAAAIRSMR